MPLWSTTQRSSSYNSTTSNHSTSSTTSTTTNRGGAPQLPPLPSFSPAQLPHFDHSSSSSTPSLSKLSISNSNAKGKQVEKKEDEEEEEDDPWQDGSEDESTIKHKFTTTSPTTLYPTKSPSSPSNTVAKSRSPTTEKPAGGGGWFSSFTSFGSSSSSTASASPSISTPSTTTAPPSSSNRSKILKRQPSAKDIAVALSPSNSPSYSSTASSTNKISPTPHRDELRRSGGSYIGKVNQVQKQAEEEVRKSLENSGQLPEEAEDIEGVGGLERESSEREKLRKSIRPEVLELVRDPTIVLPRLRREWLTRPIIPHSPSASTSQSTPTTAATTTATDQRESFDDTPRLSISSEISDDEEDGRPRGYVPLNASSLSSSTAKPVVDYQKEYATPIDTNASSQVGGGSRVVAHDLEEEPGEIGRERRRRKKFLDVLQGIKPGEEEEREEDDEDDEGERGDRDRRREDGETDLGELRKLSWGGVPEGLRVVVWMLLLGYLPSPFSRRQTTLARKRQEYADAVKLAFSRGVKGLDGPIWHQISIDVPRTRPGVRLWMVEGTQRSLERILYVWAIRHPASGYVQGINDLVTPFFQVFLSLYIDSDPESFDPSLLPPSALEALEADSFWCLSKLLDGIQDNYIFAQPGITRAVKKMELLCKRVDAPLAKHLQSEGVEFIQFAFRWMNCLLMRELSVKNIVRMWDTYLAEGGDAFSEFHLYVCLSFLVKWSEQLRTMDFQSIIMFLQSLPTKDWKDSNTELLLSEAFMWSRTFEAR